MSYYIAPFLREMTNAKVTSGLYPSQNTTGYTERQAQEGVTQPTPTAAFGKFYFGGQVITPTL